MNHDPIRSAFAVALLVSLAVLGGCRKSSDSQSDTSAATLPASLFVSTAPGGAESIASLKADAQEGDTVTIKAVVGGRKNTYVTNRAVMTVIDASVPNPCVGTDDHCPTPWDYCCTPSDQLLPQMASVQILGADNRPLALDLAAVNELKPLNTLIIQGTVGPRPDNNSLVIHATGIFVAAQAG